MELERSRIHKSPWTSPYPEPDEPSPHNPILSLQDSFQSYPPIYV
jgi:hypothetical protein